MASQASQPALSSILAELQDLRQKFEELEARQDRGHEQLALDIALDRQRIAQIEISGPFLQIKCKNDILKATGKKTAQRIASLKDLLKRRGGSQTFKKLQEDLGLSPSEFTRLVACLDKRSFEISRRPGSKRGEKVLSLRVRIVEPLVVKSF